jgi:predicted dehydrogenase
MIESVFSRSALRVAVMGLGRAAMNEHLPVLAADRGSFSVVAACELIKERRDALARVFPGCKMFRDFSDMLDERNFDAVLVSIPAVNRLKYALMSLERGFRTVLESPLALTADDAKMLRGASLKSSNLLAVVERGVLSPDFLLACKAASDARLGTLQKVVVRREEFVRRSDWRALRRTGGGAAYCELPGLVVPALRLVKGRPVQMWSDVKRIVSTGDAEDYVHLEVLSSAGVTADIEYNGAFLDGNVSPSYTLVGSRGVFRVMQGERSGLMTFLPPSYRLPRMRTTVRTPPLAERNEKVPTASETISLDPSAECGLRLFWKSVSAASRKGAAMPSSLDESIEAVRFMQLVRKSSQFGR